MKRLMILNRLKTKMEDEAMIAEDEIEKRRFVEAKDEDGIELPYKAEYLAGRGCV